MIAERRGASRPHLAGGERILSQAASEAILDRAGGGGEVTSWWNGELRWGRNRATLASDRRDAVLSYGGFTTDQFDDVSLANILRTVRETTPVGFEIKEEVLPFNPPVPPGPPPSPHIWSDATAHLPVEQLGDVARAMIAPAEAKGLLSAGYLEVRAGTRLYQVDEVRRYVRYSQAQCSMTVRDPEGTGSGWAGQSGSDWGQFDTAALAAKALAKCVASRHPVALEPGRYTVILEPQAVADLLESFVDDFLRPAEVGAEGGGGPWALSFDSRLGLWRTKLGLRVIDERLTLSHDLADPLLGTFPEPGMVPITWIDHGVLTNLWYGREYAIKDLGTDFPVRPPSISYRLGGGTTSVDEMIATTKRGLLVTRFSGVRKLDRRSQLSTGLTRDGVWLIENGKIVKPVKNFRFTESPLFMLNQVEQVGVPVPVFRPVKEPEARYNGSSYLPPLTPVVVPPIKARDFSFTAMADAV